MDFMIGINTRAPDRIMVKIKGPSMWTVPVKMIKQMDTQSRVSTIICVFERGFLIFYMKECRCFHKIATACFLIVSNFFVYNSIDNRYGCNVHNVAYRSFAIGEMNRLVQSHLDRADNFSFIAH